MHEDGFVWQKVLSSSFFVANLGQSLLLNVGITVHALRLSLLGAIHSVAHTKSATNSCEKFKPSVLSQPPFS